MTYSEQDNSESPAEGDSSGFDARGAAALLEESTRRAQRQFDATPPFLLLIGAVIFFAGYGAAWWSVRGQVPYVGPSGGALAVMYGGIIAWIVAVVTVVQRATSGVRGRSSKSRKYRGGYVIIIIAYSIFQGALYHAGASHTIVYGIFPTSAPWLFAGTVFVTLGAVREEARSLLLGAIVIGIGLASAFAGPITAWLVSGIGLCAVLLGLAILQSARRRA